MTSHIRPKRSWIATHAVQILALYIAVAVVVAIVVGLLTHSLWLGLITLLAIFAAVAMVTSALRASFQKRNGLPVRGYWNR